MLEVSKVSDSKSASQQGRWIKLHGDMLTIPKLFSKELLVYAPPDSCYLLPWLSTITGKACQLLFSSFRHPLEIVQRRQVIIPKFFTSFCHTGSTILAVTPKNHLHHLSQSQIPILRSVEHCFWFGRLYFSYYASFIFNNAGQIIERRLCAVEEVNSSETTFAIGFAS
jgi:hypothetical protein